jgi:hypothetical protein
MGLKPKYIGELQKLDPANYRTQIGEDGEYELYQGERRVGTILFYEDAQRVMDGLNNVARIELATLERLAELRAVIEEAAQVFEAGAAHNRKMGRTVFAHAQQERANRLRAAVTGAEETEHE